MTTLYMKDTKRRKGYVWSVYYSNRDKGTGKYIRKEVAICDTYQKAYAIVNQHHVNNHSKSDYNPMHVVKEMFLGGY